MESDVALFHIGPIGIAASVLSVWGIIVALGVFSAIATRRLSERPGMLQTVLEGAVLAIENTIAAVYPQKPRMLVPFIGTLWVFIVAANLLGIIPGLHSPTGQQPR